MWELGMKHAFSENSEKKMISTRYIVHMRFHAQLAQEILNGIYLAASMPKVLATS